MSYDQFIYPPFNYPKEFRYIFYELDYLRNYKTSLGYRVPQSLLLLVISFLKPLILLI